MNLLNQFKEYIKHQNLFKPKDKLLLAVSGGVDSVVLCHFCKKAEFDFSIVHCNFQLRGNDSKRDEIFVKELAQKYNVPFFVKTFDTTSIAKAQKKSIEETARDLRYNWFSELIQHTLNTLQPSGCTTYILTAHHADDNIETVLMNFFRGTGIKGLHGILPKQNKIVRPLLFANKKDILQVAQENSLQFVIDTTNQQNDFTRNYFRNELIPSIKKTFSMVEENILKNINRFIEAEQLYNQAIELHKKKLLAQNGNEIHIPVLKLQKAVPLATIIYEIIKGFNFTAHQTQEVIDLLKSESGKYIQSPSHKIIKNRKWLIISPNKTIDAQNILIDEEDKKIIFEIGELQISKQQLPNHKLPIYNYQPLTEYVDAANIQFPLFLRRWKQGDYFYPLGMQKKKKLSRFFIDKKISINQKENIWIIESNKKIICIVGMRIDDRFKITDKTKQVFKIVLKKTEHPIP